LTVIQFLETSVYEDGSSDYTMSIFETVLSIMMWKMNMKTWNVLIIQ